MPGLMAKPKIDIIAVVKDLTPIGPALEKEGFTLKGEFNIPFHQVCDKRGINNVNLHVYEEGNPEIELNLRFRDYLRAHPEAVKAYTELKKSLLSRSESHERIPMGFSKYNLGKDTFIKDILKRAGFKGVCLRYCTHHEEWEAANALNPTLSEDTDKEENVHFILYQGPEIAGYALVHPSGSKKHKISKLDLIAGKENLKPQFTALCEKWIQQKVSTPTRGQDSPRVHAL